MELTNVLFEDSIYWTNIEVACKEMLLKKVKKNYLPTYPKFFSAVTITKQFFFRPYYKLLKLDQLTVYK